jgi:hypothetical protein
MVRGEVVVNQDDGDTMDKLNRINPLYATGIDVVKADEAYEKGDFIEVGRSTLGAFDGVVMTAMIVKGGAKLRGGKKAAATDHHVMTNKNYVSGTQGGPCSPIFEDMAEKA